MWTLAPLQNMFEDSVHSNNIEVVITSNYSLPRSLTPRSAMSRSYIHPPIIRSSLSSLTAHYTKHIAHDLQSLFVLCCKYTLPFKIILCTPLHLYHTHTHSLTLSLTHTHTHTHSLSQTLLKKMYKKCTDYLHFLSD